jgi:type IV pilus assembly protein PilW
MHKQSGFTLIELMIAGFIGIFILTGLMNLFITTNKSVTLSDSLSQNQETGRFAMGYLTKYIRRAGYNDEMNTPFLPPIYMEPGTAANPITCPTPANPSASTQDTPCAVDNPDPTNILGDRLSIPINVGGDENEEITSCTGTIIGGNGTWANSGAKKIVNVFWVNDSRELRCQTFDRDTNSWLENSPVSIINNVERFEFQVGVASNSDSKNASQYVSLSTIASSSIDLTLIRSFRIAVLTTSQDDVDTKVQSTQRDRSYNLLDADTFTINDSNLRNLFMNTIELPNLIETAGN